MRVVGIGASAGGLDAIRSLVGAAGTLPGGAKVAWIVVVHLDPDHASTLAEHVQAATEMSVMQVSHPTSIAAGAVYVIPPGRGLVLNGDTLRLEPLAERSVRAPIDRFFESLAAAKGAEAAAVILSGMGSDGTEGARRIAEAGGLVLAQRPEDARCDGMPRSAVESGVVHVEGTARELAETIAAWARGERPEASDRALLARVVAVLRRETSHDFSGYRPTAMIRRIHHRMAAVSIRDAEEYAERLETDKAEARHLLDDLLIGVTRFFRDPLAFESLAENVFPALLADRDPGEPIRVWVQGCSSGEEVYSLAIALSERLATVEKAPELQVFGTDIDRNALEVARRAMYGRGIEDDVSPSRLRRYFTHLPEGWQVTKAIRAACVFAEHDVVRDPPFSRLDLVSCRNLLIYLGAEAKDRVLDTVHYALKPNGFLFLGSAEGIPGNVPRFDAVDARHRIYRKHAVPVSSRRLPPPVGLSSGHFPMPSIPTPALTPSRVLRHVERLLLEELAPPAVVVDSNHRVLFFVGRSNAYLTLPKGSTPTDQLFDLAPKTLRLALRTALREASVAGAEVRHVARLGGDPPRAVEIAVQPLRLHDVPEPAYLITFSDVPEARAPTPLPSPPDDTALSLEIELRETRAQLETTVADLEGSNDELKATNEELVSMNEELQSANEELQTSKEELQSMNEELRTLNQELGHKIDALDRANADMRNLFASTDVATLFLDRDLVINRFTPYATRLFRLIEGDVGRPLRDIAARFEGADVLAASRRVLSTLGEVEAQIYAPDDRRWYVVRIHPYRTLEDVVDGVVLTFIEVTDMKREIAERRAVEEELGVQRDRFHTALDGASIVAFSQDLELRTTWLYNPRNVPFVAEIGRTDAELFESQDEAEAITEIKRRALETDASQRAEVTITVRGDRRSFELRLKPLKDSSGRIIGLTGAAMDVTVARAAAEARLAAEREFRALFEADAVGNAEIALPVGRVTRANARFAEIAGVDSRDLEGLRLVDITDSEHVPALEALLRALSTADPRALEAPVEVRWKRPDGRPLCVQLAGAPVDGVARSVSRGVVVVSDVTDRRQLEEKLLHARKLEAIGRLAGGIAHDFNNLITVASGHLEIMQLENSDRAELGPHVAGMREALDRAAELTEQLLTFARRQAVVPRTVRPSDLVARTERMLRRVIGAEVELVVDVSPAVHAIHADATQVEQMLLNLVINARDAMPSGGRIRIEAADEVIGPDRVTSAPDAAPGSYVRFSVIDDGAGMDAETLARCLDPFFTTKPVRKGTGLGLSSVYGTARQAGGFVEIESAPGRGTAVRAYFPWATEDAPPPPEPEPVGPPRGGPETILLVEDEPMLLDLNRAALSGYGYKVLTAENGARALELVQNDPRGIQIVVTDVLMPVLGGRELAAKLTGILPNVPVLFVSGHTGAGGLPEGAAFLAKPFTPSELARRVREELDAALA